MRPQRKGFGDLLADALSKIGITEENVSRLLGKDCGCRRRREWLNRAGRWITRVLSGTPANDEEKAEWEKLKEDAPGNPGA